MKIKRTGAFFFALIMGAMALFSGCTPESPPLKTQSSDESAASQTTSAAAELSETVTSKDESSDAESSAESSGDEESIIGKSVWDDSMGELKEAAFRYERYIATDYYMSDDVQMMQRFTQALKNVTVLSETQERVEDDTAVIILNTDKKNRMFRFEHGMLVYKGKNYTVSGYEGLQKVMDDIEAAYPEWKTKYDEWIHRMSHAELNINELTLSDTYENASVEERKEKALKVLEALEKRGYIKAGTIYVSDDSISFTYDCGDSGVLGAVGLKDFDPMMN